MSGGACVDAFRRRMRHETVFGVRSIHGHVSSIVALARAGIDFAYLDQQHGCVTTARITAVVDAVAALPIVVLVRVPDSSPAAIGSALDAGADGILVPDVVDGDDAVRIVAATKYPPAGTRSWGRYAGWPPPQPGDRPLVLPMIEAPWAARDAAVIASTTGVDAIYIGRNDLAFAAGASLADVGQPGVVTDAIATVRDACDAAGIPMGTSGDVDALRAEGFRMITLGSELDLLVRAAETLRRGKSSD